MTNTIPVFIITGIVFIIIGSIILTHSNKIIDVKCTYSDRQDKTTEICKYDEVNKKYECKFKVEKTM